MPTSIRQAAEANLANGIPTSLGQALATDSMPVVLPALQATAITPPTAAAIAAAIVANPPTSPVGGVGAPKANLATEGAGAEVVIAIPAGVKFIDFLVSLAAYVVANGTAGATSFDTNQGVPYQPNLNFRLPCQGATFLHLKSTAASTLQWNTIT